MADLADRFRDVGTQEDQTVLVGMAQPESRVGLAKTADTLERILDRPFDFLDGLDQMLEGLVAERQHQRFLVVEVEVERGRRNTDPIGDEPYGRVVVALLQEQLLGSLEDFLTPCVAFASAFAARSN